MNLYTKFNQYQLDLCKDGTYKTTNISVYIN